MATRKGSRRPQQLGLRYPALLVHGLFSSGDTWKKARDRLVTEFNLTFGGNLRAAAARRPLTAADFYTLTFSENHDLTYRQQAIELAAVVRQVRRTNKSDKVILVGHSMGGLAARAYVQLLAARDVFLLITLGTPHYGSPLAFLRDNSEERARLLLDGVKAALVRIARQEALGQSDTPGWRQRVWNRVWNKTDMGAHNLMAFLESSAFTSLAPGSPALEELNRAPLPAAVRYVFVVGDITLDPALHRPDLGQRQRRYRDLWRKFARKTIRKVTSGYLADPYIQFWDYLQGYAPAHEKLSRSRLYDFDGVVPVLSQAIHHFKSEPALRVVVPLAASHMDQTNRAEKIYQALAIGGALGH